MPTGRCAVCGETDPRMGCDHNHATGLVRGSLCVSCTLARASP
ncbi:endonuclease domain-containing protein [Streptomyces sp. SudanB25_2051]